MPEARPVRRRVDAGAADVPSLVQAGVIEPPPQPSYEGLFVEPDIPPEEPAE